MPRFWSRCFDPVPALRILDRLPIVPAVECERFAGTAYWAANWVYVGQTQGRGRQGPDPRIRSTSIKDVYVLPLHSRFREHVGRAWH